MREIVDKSMDRSGLDANKVKEIVAYMKKHQVKPGIIKTQEEVDRLNMLDQYFGIEGNNWKVGDKCYSLPMNLQILSDF